MCQLCKEAADEAAKRGVSEEDIMDFFWNETPFPIAHPTPEQIEKLFDLGVSRAEMAKRFSVSRCAIDRIINRDTYKYVTIPAPPKEESDGILL